MKRKKALTILTLFFCSLSLLRAQRTASVVDIGKEMDDFGAFKTVPKDAVIYTLGQSVDWENFELPSKSRDWIFCTNLDKKILYIDLGALGEKIKSIRLKCQKNTSLLEEDALFDLPTNTIYEISLKDFDESVYFVELQTLSGVYRQKIKLD